VDLSELSVERSTSLTNVFQIPFGIKKRYPILDYRERTVPELIPVLHSQPAGDVSNKPGGKLPLLSAMHAEVG